jgi:hypothetical protein
MVNSSPVIDASDDSGTPATDQRGKPLPQKGNY